MENNKQHISYLWRQFVDDKSNWQELEELLAYVRQNKVDNDDLNQLATYLESLEFPERQEDELLTEKMAYILEHSQTAERLRDDKLSEVEEGFANKPTDPVVRRLPFRRSWVRYAAILLLLAGTSLYLYLSNQSSPKVAQREVPHDVLPGGNKALLTLSDGRTIVLDSAGSGALANQGNVKVVKLKDGMISYEPEGPDDGRILMNTMSTPKGGQYLLALPDGTRVWLNAASSITYPVLFKGNERRVEITGEAYFEVQENRQMPFVVDVSRKMQVEVLGTRFNINSYTDENSVKTTLLEGSVRVRRPIDANPGPQGPETLILKPGQQADLNSENQVLKMNGHPDLEKVMAWKNGLFNFNDASLEEVMKQLAKWYDIEVTYEKGIPEKRFWGEMSRNLKLSQVLTGLEDVRVRFRLEEGRRLVVMPEAKNK